MMMFKNLLKCCHISVLCWRCGLRKTQVPYIWARLLAVFYRWWSHIVTVNEEFYW